MSLVKFIAFTLAACTIWCGALASIGFGFGSSWHRIIMDFGYLGYLAVGVVIGLLFLVHRVRQLRSERAVRTDELA
jgi:membrane protein DedA with SNARE-associated domain